MKKVKIVTGLGYGDEGKGNLVSYLAKVSENPLIIRTNGGHQAGHTVFKDGQRHIFSTFGSGYLEGYPTYVTDSCVFYPQAAANEFLMLLHFFKDDDKIPHLYIDPNTPVCTLMDLDVQRKDENNKKHGTVGVGFGTTLKRHESGYKLTFEDLFHPGVLDHKINMIANYYGLKDTDIHKESISQINQALVDLKSCLRYSDVIKSKEFETLIFEGAQGVMLDMDHGFFPHVTRSKTTCYNAMKFLEKNFKPEDVEIELCGVIRAYHTRHGNGPFSPFEIGTDKSYFDNTGETNELDEFQGKFRTAPFMSYEVHYAITKNLLDFSGFKFKADHNLYITCIDQITFPISVSPNPNMVVSLNPLEFEGMTKQIREANALSTVFLIDSSECKRVYKVEEYDQYKEKEKVEAQ